jgi:hypothetical protein
MPRASSSGRSARRRAPTARTFGTHRKDFSSAGSSANRLSSRLSAAMDSALPGGERASFERTLEAELREMSVQASELEMAARAQESGHFDEEEVTRARASEDPQRELMALLQRYEMADWDAAHGGSGGDGADVDGSIRSIFMSGNDISRLARAFFNTSAHDGREEADKQLITRWMQGIGPMRNLGETYLGLVLQSAENCVRQKGEAIVRANENNRDIYVLVSGTAKLKLPQR